MSKFVHPTDQLATDDPDNACVNYDECENTVPGNAEMCADCLDRVRHDGKVP